VYVGKGWRTGTFNGNKLVGGLEHFIYVSIQLENVIIPTGPNSIIFQRGRVETTNQIIYY